MSKLLTLKDDLQLSDIIKEDTDHLHGHKSNYIVVRDSITGDILQVRKNLVVRKGREYNLRKIFNIPYTGESATDLNTRHINLFGIGTAGTPVSDPYSPIQPTPADTGLSREVPFRTLTGTQNLTGNEVNFYTDVRTVGSSSRQYFKKTFTRKDIVMNDTTDDYYVKLVLDITEKDARGTVISELSLFSSKQNGNNYTSPVIATRVTFQSEPLAVETRKGLTIDYYVYS